MTTANETPTNYYTSVYSGEEIDAAIGSILSNVTQYSESSTYEQGAYVLYNGQLYRANQDIPTPESWNPDHWKKISITEALGNSVSRVTPAAAGNLAALTAEGDLQDSGLLPSQAGVRKNLLDNWYFVGGGTPGNFPINQKGVKSSGDVGNNQIFIDRWKRSGAGQIVTLSSQGLTTDGTANCQIYQLHEPDFFLGRSITFSAWTSAGLFSGTVQIPDEIPSSNQTIDAYNDGNVILRIVLVSASGLIQFQPMANSVLTFYAVKAEIGETQTLCKKVINGWELIDIPNYATELLRCQPYYQLYSSAENRPSKAVDCRPTMRIDPTQGTITVDSVTYYYNSAEL